MADESSHDISSVNPIVESWRRPYTSGLFTEDEFNHFFREGYVIKHGIFSQEELQPAINATEQLVDDLGNRLYKAGKIQNLCSDADFYTRLIEIEKQFNHASVVLIKNGYLPPAYCDLYANKKLVSGMMQLMGPNVSAHPVWNLRAKTPQKEVTVVPWHQDASYMSNDCWNLLQVAAWIPLLDTNSSNGGMQVVPRGHYHGKVITHTGCSGDTWYLEIPNQNAINEIGLNLDEKAIPCDVPFGSALFFNSLLPHRSTPNLSTFIRWSLDFRWCISDKPVGFYGIKDALPLAKDGEYLQVDWNGWDKADRTKIQDMHCKSKNSVEDEFDATICGPWMNQWEITNHNRHTAKLNVTVT